MNRNGRLLASAVTLTCLVAAVVTWLAWPSAPPAPGADRVRQYADTRACLLTGATGITGTAAAAWSGLQNASTSTRAMVSYLAVPGPATRATAQPYLASLVQRQCSVIVAVGQAQVAAATTEAAKFGSVRFIVVAPRAASAAGAGVVRISPSPSAQVPTAVQAAVSTALRNG
ncbi:MAG TPA: hypothetical protein VFQ44_11115 [Streptosporangiaceae bacterium]|nr:hypothetical protein [Streptosporangiaceae bacterium]